MACLFYLCVCVCAAAACNDLKRIFSQWQKNQSSQHSCLSANSPHRRVYINPGVVLQCLARALLQSSVLVLLSHPSDHLNRFLRLCFHTHTHSLVLRLFPSPPTDLSFIPPLSSLLPFLVAAVRYRRISALSPLIRSNCPDPLVHAVAASSLKTRSKVCCSLAEINTCQLPGLTYLQILEHIRTI